MATMRRETSASPIPDWQRPHNFLGQPTLFFHEAFEAPYRSMTSRAPVEEPAVTWARQAISVIDTNRVRFQGRPTCSAIDGSMPAWAKDAIALPALSEVSLQRWLPVLKSMIRDQLPDFHLHPDWKGLANQSSSAPEIQSAILEMIAAAVSAGATSQK